MKIILAEHFGMCFGVRDAIAQAEELGRAAPLTILGELVHNPVVRERLLEQGIHEAPLDRTGRSDALTTRVMITAHGVSETRREAWRNSGFDVADGTCPLVRHAHKQLKQLVRAGYFPVVIGKPGHVEVRGLTEDFPEAVVIESADDVPRLPRHQRYGVISQTTQPIAHARAMAAEILRLHPQSAVRFVDTVCKPTKDRQRALQSLIAHTELIVVVGGRESNNTRQLVETCRAAGRRAIQVERAAELNAQAFAAVGRVGLTAGTSTLPATVEAVLQRLQEISSSQIATHPIEPATT
jgi:4-hydroxy-3-methylbut-2-enyl diphosphate reductase